MSSNNLCYEENGWQTLKNHVEKINLPENHIKHLLTKKNRFNKFSQKGGGLFYDYSHQRLDDIAFIDLVNLAKSLKIKNLFNSMKMGETVNQSENRSALHTAARHFGNTPIYCKGKDVMPDIRRVLNEIKAFSRAIHNKEIVGSTGKPFKDIVVIGIGGSCLGPEFVSKALKAYAVSGMQLHYLSNVDIHNFGAIVSAIDPESTLWVAISKSYTTPETTANTLQAYDFMRSKGLDPSRHFVAVTSKGSPGDDPSNPMLKVFHMFDFIGGRYSVTSAVGGVPLSLYLGYDVFERFLKGAEEMDIHAAETSPEENLPMIAALISIWNNNFLGYGAQAIIPYASPLSRFAPHIQQLYMESNGKSVTKNGDFFKEDTGVIIFGEPGTNAQHSFFQLAHQGRPFPVEFIGVVNPQYNQYNSMSKGVTNHQELWANMMAQATALAVGKKDEENPAKHFSGNRPSSTILLNDLSPENIGRLLSFYEARTVYEAFIWDINPFDQFGVELGKKTASGIREEMVKRNENSSHKFDHLDDISKYYLETLFSGKI
ncbi:MAG: glucose-6-phosphate isomerase [Desulfobacterales bacterium]|nr:glucose-6-phosphate isomerase [Desulfobacterales bacterium]